MRRRRRKRRRLLRPPRFRIDAKVIWITAVVLIFILALVFIGKLVYNLDAFIVTRTSIVSNVSLPPSVYSKIEGKSLFKINSADIRRRLLRERREYRDVDVNKVFPSRIVIKVKKRIPLAQVKARRFYTIDKEGVILSSPVKNQDPDLITIELSERRFKLDKGGRINTKDLTLALELIEALNSEGLNDRLTIKSINSSQAEAMYFLISRSDISGIEESSGHEIKITVGRDNLVKKLRVLKNLIDQELKDKASLVEYIDLRHKKVYVGFDR